jgi:rhamnosyltransferase
LSISFTQLASVTVAFNPDAKRLEQQLTLLEPQVGHLIVVDNGSTQNWRAEFKNQALLARLILIDLTENQGIAGGINAGLQSARDLGAEFVLCMDHDSIAPLGCVAALHDGLIELEAKGQRVAAVGPVICDQRDQHQSPFIKLGWLHHRHNFCTADTRVIETDFLITSGCFARLASYGQSAVGPLDERLFIDSVDFEWCCRARARGFVLYGVCKAVLDHRLGDSRRAVLPGWSIIVHSPERLYYMTRNRITLYGRSYIPTRWKCKDVLRMCAKLLLTLVFLPPRRTYFARSLSAVKDALTGRLGVRH